MLYVNDTSFLTAYRSIFDDAQDKQRVLDIVRRTSDALAADRATKYLPALVALTAFIGVIGVALARTKAAVDSNTLNTSIFIGLEVHGIAFTSLYFWIIPTSLFGSFIGVSQSEVSIPRILERFHRDLQDHFSRTMLDDPIFPRIFTNINTLRSYIGDTDHRQVYGGIYSWQPSRWQSYTSRQPTTADSGQDSTPLLHPEGEDGDFPEPQPTAFSRFTQWLSQLILPPALPFLIVLIPTIGGSVVSSLVPPTG